MPPGREETLMVIASKLAGVANPEIKSLALDFTNFAFGIDHTFWLFVIENAVVQVSVKAQTLNLFQDVLPKHWLCVNKQIVPR